MSLLTKGGITRLSELIIDADKNWQGMGISNLEELTLGMARGDLAVRGDAILRRLQPSTIGYILTSAGPLHIPSWQPAPGPLLYYFPVPIDLSHAEAIVAVNQSYNKNAPLATVNKLAYLDAPADMIKRLTPTVASVDAEAIVIVNQSYNKNAPMGSDLSILVDGFVEETAAGVQTDHTAEARSGAAGDLNLCPMVPTVLDKIYIGSNYKFRRVWMNYSQAGVGNWTNAAYYWNGAWVACVGEDDQTSDFQAAAGIRRIDHTPQGDWALSVIQGMNLYWMMIRTDNFANQATKPLGSQIFVSIA